MNHNKIVTGIEEIDKKRSKICIDHEEIIVLYKGEITQYKIHQQEKISEADYLIIKKEILPKRAKKRCLNLLKNRQMPLRKCAFCTPHKWQTIYR